jgi:hypothetical protein
LPQQPAEQGGRPSDQVDVEQIMREIRNRISQQHGIELSTQQIQDLAARRLEAILEPRNINPKLLEQLRKTAAAPHGPSPAPPDPDDSIADDAIYAGGAVVRFFRRLFNPLLKLLFDPAPLVTALQAQSRRNHAAATRAAEIERLQTEWNALHYQILQRLVTEVSRASIEAQALSQRVESLASRVDFNDRRVRALESALPSTRSPRVQEPAAAAISASPGGPSAEPISPATPAVAMADVPRRRRRRRRGRRASLPGQEFLATAAPTALPDGDLDEGDEEEAVEETPGTQPPADIVSTAEAPRAAEVQPLTSLVAEPALPLPGPAPEPSPVDATPQKSGVESASGSRPAPEPQPGEPNTPEQ